MRKLFYILVVCFILTSSGVFAQSDASVDTVSNLPGIEIKTSIDKAEIYIGDLVEYKLTITYDSTLTLVPPPLGANLGAFDVKDYRPDIVSTLNDGRIQSENIFVLSTFTTGDYIIPPIPVIFEMPDSSRKALLSEGVPIKVLSLLLNVDDSTDIKPLKAQYEFERDYRPYFYWGGGILFVLLIIGYLIWRRLRKVEAEEEFVDNRPAWEIAFEKLALLNQKPYVTEKKFREYYFELTEIYKAFCDKIFDKNYLDMTTEEFLVSYKDEAISENIFNRTKMFFRHADLVKFAKFTPQYERIDEDFDSVHKLIDEVRFLKQKEEEEALIRAKAAQPVVPATETKAAEEEKIS
ncbi:MAG: hypothetical protein DWP97_01270 [Calditrichaeota bacterium]|nr:MAG: hypothetical protein DWP97_01270 [Calditrichota bacterium]